MKLKKILLIDDDDTVNFISRKLIERADVTDEIVVTTSPLKALEDLRNDMENACMPEIIFVDINMPEMNGWEFVQELAGFVSGLSTTKVILLTSLINPADVEKANSIQTIAAFREKPISMEMLDEIEREIL